MSAFNSTYEKEGTKLDPQRDSPNLPPPFHGYINLMNDGIPNKSQCVLVNPTAG